MRTKKDKEERVLQSKEQPDCVAIYTFALQRDISNLDRYVNQLIDARYVTELEAPEFKGRKSDTIAKNRAVHHIAYHIIDPVCYRFIYENNIENTNFIINYTIRFRAP